ncbi:hypothetical protein GO495_12465 [Chitinophaga oryziterrae]|uniref:Collagen-like protein n=1 Tax=Chitinophaga oryziterrae TaxID=1031224 RepID=A0A6N8JA00_9BACT|nr:collagen-like protein [Chitinophaga oryziterrae]MVT41401.1 hypothetical protein [Chitinophaga oryziterrae]
MPKVPQLFVASLLCLSLFNACSKEGPTGPKGDTGETGATGAAGPTGATGPVGTANVIYSAWTYAHNFNDSTVDNSNIKAGYVDAPKITSTILNSGDVKVYFTYGGGTFILPYTSNAGGKPNTISFTPLLSKILIYRFTHDNSNSIALSTLLQYRYVIIPGGVAARKNNINWDNYAEVAAYLGWKD